MLSCCAHPALPLSRLVTKEACSVSVRMKQVEELWVGTSVPLRVLVIMIPLNVTSSFTSLLTPKTPMLCEPLSTSPLSSIQHRDRSTFGAHLPHPSHPRLVYGWFICGFLFFYCIISCSMSHKSFCFSTYWTLINLYRSSVNCFNDYSIINLVWNLMDIDKPVSKNIW